MVRSPGVIKLKADARSPIEIDGVEKCPIIASRGKYFPGSKMFAVCAFWRELTTEVC